MPGYRLYTALQRTFPLLQEAYRWKSSQVVCPLVCVHPQLSLVTVDRHPVPSKAAALLRSSWA